MWICKIIPFCLKAVISYFLQAQKQKHNRNVINCYFPPKNVSFIRQSETKWYYHNYWNYLFKLYKWLITVQNIPTANLQVYNHVFKMGNS